MTKTIHLKVTDEMYYNLASVKAKYRLDTWVQLFEYIINQEYKEQQKQPIQTHEPQPKQPLSTKQTNRTEQPLNTYDPKKPITTTIPLCACGHPKSYHAEDGCMGDGGLCECKQFKETF